MQEVRALARSGNIIWAATRGGLFAWKEGAEEYQKFTSADGLQSTDLTAVAVDNSGDVWSGTSTGIVHVYSPTNNTWRYITDIANSNQTNKRINNISIVGDTALISSSFGLSVFRRKLFQFGDTYTKFGALSGSVRVAVTSAALHGGRIWAAISDGQSIHRIAYADLSNPNLLPPEAWTLQALGSINTKPKQLAVFNNTLYTGTTTGLFALNGTTWSAHDSLGDRHIAALATSSSLLSIVDTVNNVYTISAQNVFARFGTQVPSAVNAVVFSSTSQPVVGVTDGGVMTFQNTWTSHFPNGPASNDFVSIAVDADGNVWSATGRDEDGKGFFRFDGKQWKSYSRANSALPTNGLWRVSATCNGDVWFGAFANGAAAIRVPRGAQTIDSTNVFTNRNNFPDITDRIDRYVVGAPVCDGMGNTWFPCMKPRNLRALVVRTSDGSIYNIPARVQGANESFDDFKHVSRALTVDGFNNLWMITVNPRGGVASLNNRGSATDSVADYFLNSSNGLPSDNANCIATDRDGDIWVGTDRGIGIILDPSNPTRSGAIASYKPLNGLTINAITVDPLNQKWVATNEGALLLSRDGTQTLAQYTVANTNGKIISNQIRDIAIDARTGTVYFATTDGLASLPTTAAQPKTDFDELTVSPNPYVIPNAIPLTIDGLVENSIIKILSIDGHLMREIPTPGGRIGFWDGKDANGKEVASGVYLVVAYSENQKGKVGKGKVAVIRK
jgi:ligand-binding sensor domain-containing protein